MNLLPQDFRLGLLDVFQNGDLILWRDKRLLCLDSGAVEPEHFAIVETVLRRSDSNLAAARLRGNPVTLNDQDWLGWLDRHCAKVRPMGSMWESFWAALDKIGCWHWQAEYKLPGDFENRPSLMWWVHLQRGDRALHATGWNAVPPAFDDFCRTLLDLSGREFLLPDYHPRWLARR